MSHSRHLAATDVRDGICELAKADAASPGTLECRQAQVSLLIGRYAARTPCESATRTPSTAAGAQLVERSAPSRQSGPPQRGVVDRPPPPRPSSARPAAAAGQLRVASASPAPATRQPLIAEQQCEQRQGLGVELARAKKRLARARPNDFELLSGAPMPVIFGLVTWQLRGPRSLERSPRWHERRANRQRRHQPVGPPDHRGFQRRKASQYFDRASGTRYVFPARWLLRTTAMPPMPAKCPSCFGIVRLSCLW